MRALVELALISGRGPVSASSIANRQSLSVAYLEQLLHRMKKSGLVSSTRGPRGGYVLAREPHQITIAEVVQVLDGENGGEDPAGGRKAQGEAPRHARRIASAVWRCVHERLVESLGGITLEDLCSEVRSVNGEPLDHRYVFHI